MSIKNLDIVLEYHNSPLVVWLHEHWRRRYLWNWPFS